MKFIHEKAFVEGDVELGANVSVWPFASIIGDEGKITVGDNSSVQEGVTLHGGVTIGKNVTIGHGAVLHGAKVGDNVVVGIHATILDGAEIGDWCIIAAGSVVTPNTKIEPNSMVIGTPAKATRKLEEKDKEYIISAYQNYLEKLKKMQK